MQLRVLEYFLAIVDQGSTTAAAAHVHVAQPSLSRQIRQLEHELNLTLFRRGKGALRLTPSGQAFLPVARDLVSRAALARATARSLATGAGVPLRVIAPPTTVADVVAPFVVSCGAGGSIVDVVEASPNRVYSALADGQADFAIGTRPPGVGLRHVVLGRAPVWVQVPLGHIWHGRDDVILSEISTVPVVVMDEDHGVRRIFDEAMAGAGLGYDAAYVARSPEVAQALTAAGRGACILSDEPRFGLHAIPIRHDGSTLHVTLFGAWDPTHYAAEQIRICLNDLVDFCASLFGPHTPVL